MKPLIPLLFLLTATLPAQILSITEFPVPAGSGPHGITTGPDGALWFIEGGGKIARMTTTGAVKEYPIPGSAGLLWALTAGPDGAMWFTGLDGHAIGRITTTGAINLYTLPGS